MIAPAGLIVQTFVNTCDVQRSATSGGTKTAPANVATGLACGIPQDLTNDEKERAGLASVSRPVGLNTAVPDGENIRRNDYIVVGSETFRVIKVTPRPGRNDVQYYDLIMDYK